MGNPAALPIQAYGDLAAYKQHINIENHYKNDFKNDLLLVRNTEYTVSVLKCNNDVS